MSQRERVEDLGRITEIISVVQERLSNMTCSLKVMKPVPVEGDLEDLYSQIEGIIYLIDTVWEIARWGDDEA